MLRFNLFIDLEHSGIHNAHVHARRDGVAEKRGVNRFADLVIAARREPAETSCQSALPLPVDEFTNGMVVRAL